MQQLLSEGGTKHSSGHIRSILFQAKVDSAYLHRGLELPPRVISRRRMMDEVVKLIQSTHMTTFQDLHGYQKSARCYHLNSLLLIILQ